MMNLELEKAVQNAELADKDIEQVDGGFISVRPLFTEENPKE